MPSATIRLTGFAAIKFNLSVIPSLASTAAIVMSEQVYGPYKGDGVHRNRIRLMTPTKFAS